MVSIPKKVALNSNIILSALIGDGIPRQLILLLAYHDIELFIPQYVFDEVEDKLRTKKYFVNNRLKLELEVLNIVKQICQIVPTNKAFKGNRTAVRDIKDIPVLEACLTSGIEVLVTGDPDLFVLKNVNSLKIIQTNKFYNQLQKQFDS